jgi:actin-like ATPase involved in cell morphogenesis
MVDELKLAEAMQETARLQRELDITNADHVALWLEANTIPDEPMSQCISWLACRIVDAHEAALTRTPPEVSEEMVDKVEALIALAYEAGWDQGCETLVEDHPTLAPILETPHRDCMGEGCGTYLKDVRPTILAALKGE